VNAGTQAVVADFEYGPFGEEIRASGEFADELTFRFSTKYEDSETGYLYYGFRYYDADRGRRLNRDPMGEREGRNLYGMVGNDPIYGADALGLRSNVEIFMDFTQTIDACEDKYPRVVVLLEDILNEWVDSNSGIRDALQTLKESAAKIESPFRGKDILVPTLHSDLRDELRAAQFLGGIFGDEQIELGKDGKVIADLASKGTGVLIEPVEFGFDVHGKISKFADMAEAPFSSNKAAISAITTIATAVDKFGGAAGPIGSYYNQAIRGIDRALTETGRNLTSPILSEIMRECQCVGSEPDYRGNRELFENNINRLRNALK